MEKEIIFLVEEDVDGGYTAKSLGYSIFTEGENLEEIRKNILDALRCHFEGDRDMPKIVRLHIVKEEVIENV